MAIRADPEPGQAAGSGRRLLETVIANDGFNMELGVGINAQYGSAYGEEFQWNSPGTITAVEVVPESASLSLLVFGMFGITLLRRNQR